MKIVVIHHVLFLILLLFIMLVLLYREKRIQDIQGFVDTPILKGRFIRIEMGQVGCLNLADIAIMSKKDGPNIISPSMVVTTSSSYANNAPSGSLFVDQNINNIVVTSCADKGWVMVDLGAMLPIYQIIVTNRTDCCRQRANGAVLTILNDQQKVIFTADPIRNKAGSTTYTEADNNINDRSFYKFTYFPSNTTAVIGSDHAPVPASAPPSALQGRFIRIEMGQVGCLNLGEIMVYSEKNGKNIILPSTPVTASSSFGNNAFPGPLFVDQKPDTFVHTSCADKGWVMVDLGAMKPIYQIVIINRSDCCRQRANGAVLTILNDQRNVIYTANPIRNKAGNTTYTEADNSVNDRSYRVFTYFPPKKDVVGSDTLPTPAIKCGSNNFCVGMRNNLPHCYGKKDGCLWGSNDCTKDADCSKYTEASPAYTDGRPCAQFKLGDWPYDACPEAAANFDVRIAPNQPTKTYQDMKKMCEAKGKTLCRSSDICNKNRQVSMAGLTTAFSNDNWIAVGDKDNEWLTLNQGGGRYCKTHTEVAGSVPSWGTSAAPGGWERLAKCCPT